MDSPNTIYKIVTEYQEKEEEFIFTTIQPFCSDILKRHISKEELKNALLLYEKAKQLLGVENERFN